ncbi:MAG: hypothetical protein HZC42_15505 [Candidatus Eisenbacteria bacterium]|nr:hypothetical protein [Candidatus Eisenbacteria bacterium]
MVAALLGLILLTTSGPARTDTPAAADSLPPVTRIVRRFEPVEVRALFHDLRSSEVVQLIPARSLRELPVDGLVQAVALQSGVVAVGEDLHVRGGRAGEVQMLLAGVPLNEVWRGRVPEVPLLPVREVELLAGGLDARYGGSLAGVVQLRTVDPGARWNVESLYQSDGRRGTGFDRGSLLLSGPLGVAGLGFVVNGEVIQDGTYLPELRTQRRSKLARQSFGWRADNHLLGYAKLVPAHSPQSASLEVLASRRLEQPYDPMWTQDGWVQPCDDPWCRQYGEPRFSPDYQPGYVRYRAADHVVMTDERRLAAVASVAAARGTDRAQLSLGWVHARRLVSLGARDDDSYITAQRLPVFGRANSPLSDPFRVYWGDDPFFQRSRSDALTLRLEAERITPRDDRLGFGLGLDYQSVALRELDGTAFGLRVDSLRSYRAWAPGGYAYVQGRWAFEGLVLNTGLRASYFTAGPQAPKQQDGAPARDIWSFSPRLGFAYPVSDRDVFSLSYARFQQDPPRDFLYDNRWALTIRQPLGNPRLLPATVISYQTAVKHRFDSVWALQTALFYRDVWGQVGTRNYIMPPGYRVARYENSDEGHALGGELTVFGAGARVRAELHYTYLTTWGTESLEEGTIYGPPVGLRPRPLGTHPLDWDRTHSIRLAASVADWGPLSLSWITSLGSGLPWTPRARRELQSDEANVNARRLGWTEATDVSLRLALPWLSRIRVGLEVRNLFDRRDELGPSVNGFPNPYINTIYDDYGAYRTETGRGGGGYLNDANGDGVEEWVAVHDPRLYAAPRRVRMSVRTSW